MGWVGRLRVGRGVGGGVGWDVGCFWWWWRGEGWWGGFWNWFWGRIKYLGGGGCCGCVGNVSGCCVGLVLSWWEGLMIGMMDWDGIGWRWGVRLGIFLLYDLFLGFGLVFWVFGGIFIVVFCWLGYWLCWERFFFNIGDGEVECVNGR